MLAKFIVVCFIHFSSIFLILKLLNLLLPCYITSYYFKAADLLLCLVVAKFTFRCSKKLFMKEQIPIQGKAVLITGCARGIGKSIARHLDSEGFHVFASCRNPDSPGVDDLRKTCSNRLKIIPLDVTKDESVEEAVQFVESNLGNSELWAIINNAGIQSGFILELTRLQDFKDTLEVNAIGQVRVTKAFLPLLRKSRGRVINMNSISGRLPLPMVGSYTMSKYAAIGFTENLRIELDAWGIQVISIEPELFETDLVNGEKIKKRIDEAFSSAKEDVRKEYGEEYIRKFKLVASVAFPASRSMQKVLEDIDCALRLKYPEAVYTTCRNMFVKIFFDTLIACPIELQVFLSNFYYRILGLPNPEMTEENEKKYD